MRFELWYLTLGTLLVVIALVSSVVKRLPLTTTMLYLAVGVVLGPLAGKVILIDPMTESALIYRLAELGVIVSLFTAGLKLRVSLRDKTWVVPLRLAFVSMGLTVGLVAIVGVWGLGLPIGAAILLGAILAPTDPVLASEVQLESVADRDKLRFSLTGEAGFNDGTAFPFVMLGLGLMGLHDLGAEGWRWFAIDVVWAVLGGLGIGAVSGILVGRLVLYLRREHKEGFGSDEFLTLGLIGLSYGAAVLAQSYGFLAVFAAGLALHGIERRRAEAGAPKTAPGIAAGHRKEFAARPEKSPLHLSEAVLVFNEQVERILEVALVLLVGTMLAPQFLSTANLWFVPLLLLVIRPAAVGLGLIGCSLDHSQRGMISWFGIRGIGSLYYLMFAIVQGVPTEVARELVSLTLWVIVVSVVVHGISVTPLMNWYQSRRRRHQRPVGKELRKN
jgi:sodium/hydrogen antiporter